MTSATKAKRLASFDKRIEKALAAAAAFDRQTREMRAEATLMRAERTWLAAAPVSDPPDPTDEQKEQQQ